MLIPRTQTSRHLLDFFKLHRTREELIEREQLHRQLGLWVPDDTGGKDNPFGKDFDPRESENVFMDSSRVADRCEFHM